MIIPTRWQDVPANARVIDPAGQVFHALAPAFPGIRAVRDAKGNTFAVQAPPQQYVPRLYELEDGAVAVLSQHFQLEFLREGK